MFIAALNRRLTVKMLNEAIFDSCRANGLVFMIFLGATGFSYVFRVLGGDELMISTLAYFGIDTEMGDAHLRDGSDLPARLPV